MDRRSFLKTTTLAAAGEGMVCGLAGGAQDACVSPQGLGAPAVVAAYSREDHRRRLENIAYSGRRITACLRKQMVTNYLPARCCYNLGEYPADKPWNSRPPTATLPAARPAPLVRSDGRFASDPWRSCGERDEGDSMTNCKRQHRELMELAWALLAAMVVPAFNGREARAADAAPQNVVLNPGFEAWTRDGRPDHWSIAGGTGHPDNWGSRHVGVGWASGRPVAPRKRRFVLAGRHGADGLRRPSDGPLPLRALLRFPGPQRRRHAAGLFRRTGPRGDLVGKTLR